MARLLPPRGSRGASAQRRSRCPGGHPSGLVASKICLLWVTWHGGAACWHPAGPGLHGTAGAKGISLTPAAWGVGGGGCSPLRPAELSRGCRRARKQPSSIGLGRRCLSVAVLCLGAGLACSVSAPTAPRWKTDPEGPPGPPVRASPRTPGLRARGGWQKRYVWHNPGSQRSGSPARSLRFKCRLYSRGFNWEQKSRLRLRPRA